MEFKIAKKSQMNTLYRLIKKLYQYRFYDYLIQANRRMFYYSANDENYFIVVIPDQKKMDFFVGDRALLCCHYFMSGDESSVRKTGVTGYSIEPYNEEMDFDGRDLYLKKFTHYKDEGVPILYYSTKPGQKSCVLSNKEASIFIDILKRLLTILKEIKTKHKEPEFDSLDNVTVVDFKNSRKIIAFDHEELSLFDINPGVNMLDLDPSYFSDVIKKDEILDGVIHIGFVYSFETVELYENKFGFEHSLSPIILYAMSENGDISHLIYTTPADDWIKSTSFILKKFLLEYGVYDTYITDNIYLYATFAKVFESYGIDFKFVETNKYNIFITKYVLNLVTNGETIDDIDAILINSKSEVKQFVLDNVDDLESINEHFDDSPIIEEDDNDEEPDLEEESEYVS